MPPATLTPLSFFKVYESSVERSVVVVALVSVVVTFVDVVVVCIVVVVVSSVIEVVVVVISTLSREVTTPSSDCWTQPEIRINPNKNKAINNTDFLVSIIANPQSCCQIK